MHALAGCEWCSFMCLDEKFSSLLSRALIALIDRFIEVYFNFIK